MHHLINKTQSKPELGTRQHCCDNVTMIAGLKVVGFSILLYLLWQLRLDTKTSIFFEICLIPEALLLCRVVVVAKLKKIVACPALK